MKRKSSRNQAQIAGIADALRRGMKRESAKLPTIQVVDRDQLRNVAGGACASLSCVGMTKAELAAETAKHIVPRGTVAY